MLINFLFFWGRMLSLWYFLSLIYLIWIYLSALWYLTLWCLLQIEYYSVCIWNDKFNNEQSHCSAAVVSYFCFSNFLGFFVFVYYHWITNSNIILYLYNERPGYINGNEELDPQMKTSLQKRSHFIKRVWGAGKIAESLRALAVPSEVSG